MLGPMENRQFGRLETKRPPRDQQFCAIADARCSMPDISQHIIIVLWFCGDCAEKAKRTEKSNYVIVHASNIMI
jgi:hypothetical protein